MSANLNNFFGFKKEPFRKNLSIKELMDLPDSIAVKERVNYTLPRGGVLVITGEVGTGKSTALRWALDSYHSSDVHIIKLIASTTSLIDFLRQVSWELGLSFRGASRSLLVKEIKKALSDIALKKRQKVLLAVDEAQLLSHGILEEVHTLTNFSFDSESHLSIIFAGQTTFLEKLSRRNTAPLASRVIAKSHLNPLTKEQLNFYIEHHLKVSGGRADLFTESALHAIYKGTGGLLRKTNNLASGALMSAFLSEKDRVDEEDVRLASEELIL